MRTSLQPATRNPQSTMRIPQLFPPAGRAGKRRLWLWLGVFLAASVGWGGIEVLAAGPQAGRTEQQLETTVLHVDKYGVYAPNLIFYWDPGMNKQKVDALSGVAMRLRNKEVVITYSTVSDLTKDRRPLLIDIVAVKREAASSGDLQPAREPPKPAVAEEEKPKPPPARVEPAPESEAAALPKPPKETPPEPRKPMPSPFTTISRAEVVKFVRECLDATQSKDMERALACYGDQVDYYSKGTVNQDFLRRDKSYYFRNWDRIQSSLDGDIVLIVIDQPDLKIAKFNSRFFVQNARNTVSGRAENIWKIQKIGNELKIVDEKQKIIERDAR